MQYFSGILEWQGEDFFKFFNKNVGVLKIIPMQSVKNFKSQMQIFSFFMRKIAEGDMLEGF